MFGRVVPLVVAGFAGRDVLGRQWGRSTCALRCPQQEAQPKADRHGHRSHWIKTSKAHSIWIVLCSYYTHNYTVVHHGALEDFVLLGLWFVVLREGFSAYSCRFDKFCFAPKAWLNSSLLGAVQTRRGPGYPQKFRLYNSALNCYARWVSVSSPDYPFRFSNFRPKAAVIDEECEIISCEWPSRNQRLFPRPAKDTCIYCLAERCKIMRALNSIH